jgi:hypothetical protein
MFPRRRCADAEMSDWVETGHRKKPEPGMNKDKAVPKATELEDDQGNATKTKKRLKGSWSNQILVLAFRGLMNEWVPELKKLTRNPLQRVCGQQDQSEVVSSTSHSIPSSGCGARW